MACMGVQSRLRLPGHSRASFGGTGMSGVKTDSSRKSTAGRMQSDPGIIGGDGQQPSMYETGIAIARPEQSPTSAVAALSGGHIRVAVRVRPLPQDELGIIEVAGSNTVLIQKDATPLAYLSSQQGRIETRSFDRVFGPQATQEEVYEYSCAPLMNEAIAAARCATVFAYGATGAGKTHTMFGNPEAEQRGVVLRAIPDVFKYIAEYNAEVDSSEPTLQVKASFLEIYNETVRDLLQDGGGMCKVLEDERRGVVQVSNLFEPSVSCAEDALAYLQVGMQSRTVEATAANLQSSRAHAVFSLTIERVWPQASQNNLRSRLGRGAHGQRQLHSKISFIDLAGSERAAFTQNVGQALKDGARINQSLLALANCIDALVAKSRLANSTQTPRKKPPYRDSKLTLMLKGSLIGDGLVAMMANVHPGRLNFEDSNNTLEYAKRASTVKASSRRLSCQGFGIIEETASAAPNNSSEELGSRVPRGVVDDLNDGGHAAKMSVSSLPKPRRTRPGQPFAHLCAKEDRDTPYGEITTASSPEECLSELSLSSGQDPGEEAETASGSDPSASSSAPPNGEAPGEEPLEYQKACWGLSEQPQTETSTPQRSETEEEEPGGPFPGQAVAVELVATLQKDNQRMDARLRLVTRERNALLQDRQTLEDENERLRQESIKKDRQLLALLGRRQTFSSSSSSPSVSPPSYALRTTPPSK